MSRRALETIFDGMAAGRAVPEYMHYLQKGDYNGLTGAYLSFGGDEVFSAMTRFSTADRAWGT